jgi:hypothetical protein
MISTSGLVKDIARPLFRAWAGPVSLRDFTRTGVLDKRVNTEFIVLSTERQSSIWTSDNEEDALPTLIKLPTKNSAELLDGVSIRIFNFL